MLSHLNNWLSKAAAAALMFGCLASAANGQFIPGGVPIPGGITGQYGPGANPYSAIAPNFGGVGGVGAYSPYSPYSPYNYPNYYNPYSGIADIVGSQGRFLMNRETARVIREKAFQEHLKSRKAAIELNRWYEATKERYSDKVAKEMKRLVKRIQLTATPTEVWSGRALNVMLADLTKQHAKETAIAAMTFSQDMLRHVNVTVKGKPSLGMLREDAEIEWPLAIEEIEKSETLKNISELTKKCQQRVREGKSPQKFMYRDLEASVRRLNENLENSYKKLSARRYLEASYFLESFQSAVRGLNEKGVARHHYQFQKWVKDGNGNRTLKEVVDYLNSNGLVFAPAVDGDEASYQALYNALAGYSLDIHGRKLAKGDKSK